MCKQDMQAKIASSMGVKWFTDMTQKQYVAANTKKSVNPFYTKIYAKIAAADYYYIVDTVRV